MKVTEFLKKLREDNNLYSRQVAEGLNISLYMYRHYETGRKDIPFGVFMKLLKFYNYHNDITVYPIDKRNHICFIDGENE